MERNFDLESVYDEQINPLVAQIIAIAKEHGMPILFSAAYAHDDQDGTDFCSTHWRPPERQIDAFDDCVGRLMRPHVAFSMMVTTKEPK